MLKATRHNRIRTLVDEMGQVTVTELNELLGVSEATIRRDLVEMEDRGWVVRSHGGAIRTERVPKEPPLLERSSERSEEKRRIARRAAQRITTGDTVFLGSGTTVAPMVDEVGDLDQLTVITNSLPVITALSTRPNVDLIVIGGVFRRSELSMVGHIAEQAIQMFRADHVFMGMRAIDVRHGFTGDAVDEAMTDRAILAIAPSVVVLADSTKFGRVSTVAQAPITAASTIITDSGLDPVIAEQVRSTGIDLEVV